LNEGGFTMTVPTLHVVFNMSAAGGLRKALAQLGRHDRVAALGDDLSFGPINPPDPDLRAQWVEAELGYDNWGDIGGETFWIAALSDQSRRIAWMSRRSAQEYAGFLEFVWRLGSSPCEVIDLTEVTVIGRHNDGEPPAPRLAVSLAFLAVPEILENNLLDRAQPLTEDMREACRATWKTLRGENEALRILDADLALRSAPISFFDQQLLSCASHRWLKAARIVGQTLTKLWDNNFQIGDLVPASRLHALVEAGLLESKGDLTRLTFSEVRLPATRT
jgi:hypothetical protein